MTELKNVKEKEAIAIKIKYLVNELNSQIHLANDVFLSVRFFQNMNMGNKSSDISIFITDTISY